MKLQAKRTNSKAKELTRGQKSKMAKAATHVAHKHTKSHGSNCQYSILYSSKETRPVYAQTSPCTPVYAHNNRCVQLLYTHCTHAYQAPPRHLDKNEMNRNYIVLCIYEHFTKIKMIKDVHNYNIERRWKE